MQTEQRGVGLGEQVRETWGDTWREKPINLYRSENPVYSPKLANCKCTHSAERKARSGLLNIQKNNIAHGEEGIA